MTTEGKIYERQPLDSGSVSKAEDKGRTPIEKVFDKIGIDRTKWEETPDQGNHIDIIFPDSDLAIEVKNRDIDSVKYFHPGYLLQMTKYHYLMQHRKGYYVCVFRDVIIFWNLRKISTPEWYWKLCTSTTLDGTYEDDYSKKEWKEVCDLQASEASSIFDKATAERIDMGTFLNRMEKEWQEKEAEDAKIQTALARELSKKMQEEEERKKKNLN